MRSVIAFIIVACFFYWLFGNGIVTFDGLKAKYHVGNAIEKLNSLDAEKAARGASDGNMKAVDRETDKLCEELRGLSERALMLRKKLLANVVESTDKADFRKRRR